jgi:KDO2-lipid IV(A) lauroyltransferase
MSDKRPSLKTRVISALAVGLICLFGALPLAVNRALGGFFGWLMYLFPSDNKRSALINLALCFPDKSEAERRRLARATLIESGKGALEVAWVWRNPHKALTLVRNIKGEQLLADAMASGRPVVVLAPHVGCWELMNYWLSSHYDMHILFMPSGLPGVDALIQKSRETFRTTAYPITPEGVAELNKSLTQGHVITGVLPDQVALRGRGIFVDFFGVPAYTSPHSCRLIQKHNAIAVTVAAKRLPGTQGYDLFIEPTSEALFDENVETALTALNRDVEKAIMEMPEQYLWSYKRFRRQPEGRPNPYH